MTQQSTPTPSAATPVSSIPAPTERAAVRRTLNARDLASIATFAALIAALGLPGSLQIGTTGVPITFQTLGVMLAGAILGARNGFLAVLLLQVLVAAGLPLLSGGRGGIAVFVGPTGGYLVGWLLGVLIIGWFTARLLPRYPLWAALPATALGGIVAIYAIGVPWLVISTGTPFWVALSGSFIFLPGDLLKVIVTVLVAKQVHRAWPGLIAPRGRRATASATPTLTESAPA